MKKIMAQKLSGPREEKPKVMGTPKEKGVEFTSKPFFEIIPLIF